MKLYDDPEIAKKINTLWKKARTDHADWRKQAEEDFNFPAGHQWEEADLTKLKDQNRPVVTFNRCNPILSAILGMEANQRQQVSFNPRGNTDTGLSDAINFVAKWAREYGETEFEESQAFEDMLTCGMGWTNTYVDYDEDLDGKICQEMINPFQMEWDPSAKKRNLTDAGWKCYGKKMAPDEIKDRWPDAEIIWDEDQLRDDNDDEDGKADAHESKPEKYTDAAGNDGTNKDKVTVLQFQWFEKVPVYRVALPTSPQIFTMPREKYKKLEPYLTKQGAKSIEQYQKKYYEAFVFNDTLLEKKDCASQTGYTFKCLTGKRDKMRREWYGIVRLMKDPQRWANKFFSTFIDIIDANSKGGMLIEEGAVSDVRKFEEDWAKADSVIWMRQGAISGARIKEKPRADYPQAVDRLMQLAIQSIYDCTGMNMEMLGLADRAQPNVLEETRKKSAYTILAPFFDSLRAYRKEGGVILIEYIKNYLPINRIVEVLEPEYKPYAQTIKNMDLAQMNIVVSESPQSDNHKMIVWAFISQIAPQLMKAGVPIPPEILDYSPLPAPLTEKWKGMIQKGSGQNPEQQKMMQEMQQMIQKLQSENQQLKSKREEKMAELQMKQGISAQELQLERAKLSEEFALEQEKLNQKMRQFMMELHAEMMMSKQELAAEMQTRKIMHAMTVNSQGGAKNAD